MRKRRRRVHKWEGEDDSIFPVHDDSDAGIPLAFVRCEL